MNDFFRFRVTPILSGELPETIKLLHNISADGLFNISITLGKL